MSEINDYILHLCVRDVAYSPRIRLEKQYAFNREKGESWKQLRERMSSIMHKFGFTGEFPEKTLTSTNTQ